MNEGSRQSCGEEGWFLGLSHHLAGYYYDVSEKIKAGSWTYSVSSARFLTSNIRNKYVCIQQTVHKNGLLGNHSAIELYRVTYKASCCGRYSVRAGAPWRFKTRIETHACLQWGRSEENSGLAGRPLKGSKGDYLKVYKENWYGFY